MSKRILHPLFNLLGSLTQQEMARQVSYLKEENKVLRERLPDPPRIGPLYEHALRALTQLRSFELTT
jgi:hypothetical protein